MRSPMIVGLLRLASTAATAFIVLSFALFAIDQTGSGSDAAVARLAGEASAERQAAETSGIRGAIDDVGELLLTPVDGFTPAGQGEWARRAVPAVLGVLLYGVLLRLLANMIPPARRAESLGWEVPR